MPKTSADFKVAPQITLPSNAPQMKIGFSEIKEKYLPHGYPMLMLDRVVDHKAGEYIKAIKCVTGNAPEMAGHFPEERSIFPGTNILQAFAQLGIVFHRVEFGQLGPDELTLITQIEGKFLGPVYPGDVLEINMTPRKLDEQICMYNADAFVGEKRVAAGKLTLVKRNVSAIPDPLW
ncbi:MAG: 3-hydroxyacyl-[acyl-carrier-protein] dehydratase [Verrucomicrobiales bacterium]